MLSGPGMAFSYGFSSGASMRTLSTFKTTDDAPDVPSPRGQSAWLTHFAARRQDSKDPTRTKMVGSFGHRGRSLRLTLSTCG